MASGEIVHLCIGPEPQGPMRSVEEVRAVAGRGLEGDRYFQAGPPAERDPSEEVTLIASEGIEAAARSSGIDIRPEDTRRNLVTKGIALEDLVGRTFAVGAAQLEGIELNPPCKHLERVSGKAIMKPLVRRGGIRARILTSGTIRVGDEIAPIR